MSREDFCASTPEQFSEIYKAFAKYQENETRAKWERARFTAYHTIRHKFNKGFKPQNLAKFTWEIKTTTPKKRAEVGTKEDFEKAKKLYGV